MSNCLCIYYSRTGNTRAVMEKIAELLDAELLEITDGKARKGVVGFVAAGLDAMKKTPEALMPFQTKHPLGQYDGNSCVGRAVQQHHPLLFDRARKGTAGKGGLRYYAYGRFAL